MILIRPGPFLVLGVGLSVVRVRIPLKILIQVSLIVSDVQRITQSKSVIRAFRGVVDI